MSRSWKIAVSLQREHRGEWREGVAPGAGPAGERAFWWLPCCPHTPALGESEITADTCQAILPRDRARLIQTTRDNGLQAHSEV